MNDCSVSNSVIIIMIMTTNRKYKSIIMTIIKEIDMFHANFVDSLLRS